MMSENQKTGVGLFAVAVFLSAFLLFSVQPMVAKYLLPAFGGTAGVWATCLAVFQVLLLAGYAYAHWLCRSAKPGAQRWVHLAALGAALLFLPIVPRVPSAAEVMDIPVWQLMRTLAISVGLPFLALSATAPLLMDWFRQSHPGRTPDRLYAFSNAGSLLALVLYPVLIDPAFARHTQARLWAGGMVMFVVVCALIAWGTRNCVTHGASALAGKGAGLSPKAGKAEGVTVASPPASGAIWLWIVLPACGSGLLLALTNQICQDVTPVPLLWMAPMSVYLVTFILCFEGPRSYKRGLFMSLCMAGLLLLAWLLYYGGMHGFGFQVGAYLAILFAGCMVCHGEVYRIRPGPEKLTAYYLCIALGGAVGGTFVAIVAPLVFKGIYETPFLTLLLASLVTLLVWRERLRISLGGKGLPAGPVALTTSMAILLALVWVVYQRQQQSIYSTRSFYGVYQVKEGPTWLINNVPFPLVHGPGRVLVSGQVYHGFQFLDPKAGGYPTTYYSPESGLGLAFRELTKQTNRWIGAVGLGTGTLAAYARPGDRIRAYELNPDVVRIAQRYFTFLTNSPAKIDVVLGDGRVSLEREPDHLFDLLVLDAFSGDSIPTHLLTDEAMRVYLRHLAQDGVMAFHISNTHLDLEPVVRALANQHGLRSILVPPVELDPRTGKLSAIWMLVTASDAFCARQPIRACADESDAADNGRRLLWTDDHFSILPILR
jgi:hypothetical protein